MLLRLPFLFLGALGLPVLLALSVALALAQWRSGEELEPILLPTAAVSVILLAWLWWARARTDSATRGLLAVSARMAPWLAIPGAVAGLAIGIKVHIDYLDHQERERTELASSVCDRLKLDDERCIDAARTCLPRPRPISTLAESHRECIEARLH